MKKKKKMKFRPLRSQLQIKGIIISSRDPLMCSKYKSLYFAIKIFTKINYLYFECQLKNTMDYYVHFRINSCLRFFPDVSDQIQVSFLRGIPVREHIP